VPDAGPNDDEVLARIRSATVELGESAELDELPLTEVADRLGELHRELQDALADLDRA
jgi:hypothetical protein